MPSTPSSPSYVVDGKTDAERYLEGCLDGTHVVGRHIRRLAEIMLPQIRDGYKKWHYSQDAALRPVRFIERFCRIPSAEKMGQPFILEPYERMIVELAFGFVDENNNRRFREVFVEIGRKNGKTALCAALNLYMLTNAETGGANECYNGACTTQQARLCMGATVDMAEMSPMMKKRLRKGLVTKRGISGLNYDKTKSYLCTIAGNAQNLDGLNLFWGVLDELGACRDNGAVYGILKGAMNREDAMLFIISTNGHVRYNIFDDRLNYAYDWLGGKIEADRFLGILYELDDKSEMYDETMWPKANPGLGTVKSWDAMRDIVTQGLNNPRDLSEVQTKQFNLPANFYSSFLTREECHNPEKFDFNPKTDRYGVVGFDLADRGDLCAAVCAFLRPNDERIYEIAHFWIPEESVKINSNNFKERDSVPYHLWRDQGWITIVDSDRVDQRVIIDWIQELADMGMYTRYVGYDPWHVDDWSKRELSMMVGESNIEPIPQQAKVLSPAMRDHQLDLRAKRIINPSPLTEFCRANTQSKPPDANNNYFPQKRDLKPNMKIDGYMAELFAMIELKKHLDEMRELTG